MTSCLTSCLQGLQRLNSGRICSNGFPASSFPALFCGSLNPSTSRSVVVRFLVPQLYTCQARSMASLRRSARISSSTSLALGALSADIKTAAAPSSRATSRKRKEEAPPPELKEDNVPAEAVPQPSTPPPKKRRGRPSAAAEAVSEPPVSATPSRSTSVSRPPTTPKTPRPRHPTVNRLANPDVSNAMLISPETSRVVSALPLDSMVSMSATIKMTTSNILDDACAHLVSVDPRMKKLVDAHYCKLFSPASLAEKVDPFESLASGIISQQVSGAAARAIKGRFVDLFEQDGEAGDSDQRERTFPQPSQVAAMSIEKLRSAGLSQRKAEYLKGLGEKFVSGDLSTQLLAEAPYDTLVERLIAVRGLGLWSVEMFAMFGLKRMDVFSVGDLGVQRGMAAFAGRDIAKLKRAGSTANKKNAKWKYMAEKEMVAMAEPFRPYRSVFMWYMWQVESVDVGAMD